MQHSASSIRRPQFAPDANASGDALDFTGMSHILKHRQSSLEHFIASSNTSAISTPSPPPSPSRLRDSTPAQSPEAPAHLGPDRRVEKPIPTSPELKKKHSPTSQTLRQMREKQSEVALRRAYESQTLAYLNDAIQPRQWQHEAWVSSSDSSTGEDILSVDTEEDEEAFVLAPEHWWSESSIVSPRDHRSWGISA